jgi:hypothetical protein
LQDELESEITAAQTELMQDNVIILIDKDNPWQSLYDSLPLFTDDFIATQEQLPVEAREEF